MATISDLNEQDRPREKLLEAGASILTASELLAIVLQTSGQKGKSVVEMANSILRNSENSFRNLAKLRPADLTKFPGIGKAKAATIMAVLEIAKRHEGEIAKKQITFKNPSAIAKHFMPFFRDKEKEILSVLLFDRRHRFMKKEAVNVGNLARVSTSPREIFHPAIREGAAGLILMHNHPSGDPSPSSADVTMTEKVLAASKLLQIPVLDHLILGKNDFFSFMQSTELFE